MFSYNNDSKCKWDTVKHDFKPPNTEEKTPEFPALEACETCGSDREPGDQLCSEQRQPECRDRPTESDWLAECGLDLGQVLDIETTPGARVLDLGSSNDCVRHGHNQHADYIHLHKFCLDHLPEKLRHQALLDYVKAKAAVTVRIVTKWTSLGRPDNDPYAKQRGTKRSRIATGMCNTTVSAETFLRQQCKLPNCHRKSDLGEYHTLFSGEIFIYTNKHVVFDDEEMKHTTVEFFYDSEDKSNVVKEYGLQLRYTKTTSDRTFFIISIHDERFLNQVIQNSADLWMKECTLPSQIIQNLRDHVIIVSHPHGMPKKISVGEIVKEQIFNSSTESENNAKRLGQMYHTWAIKRHDEMQGKTSQAPTGEKRKMKDFDNEHYQKELPIKCKKNRALSETNIQNESLRTSCFGNDADENLSGHEIDINPKVAQTEHRIDEGCTGNDNQTDTSIINCKHLDKDCHKSNEELLKASSDRDFHDKKVKRDFEVAEISKILSRKRTAPASPEEESKISGVAVTSDQSTNGNATDTRRMEDDADERDEEEENVKFMSSAVFPVVMILHNAPTCQGSSGAPVIHRGFHVNGFWVPQTGGHFGFDNGSSCSFFRFIKATP